MQSLLFRLVRAVRTSLCPHPLLDDAVKKPPNGVVCAPRRSLQGVLHLGGHAPTVDLSFRHCTTM